MDEREQERPQELAASTGGGRRIRGWLLAGTVLVILIGIAFAARFLREEAPASKQGPEAVPVAVAAAARGDVRRSVKLTGRVAPRLEINLLPKIPGRIEAVSVDVGDRVRPGQVLVQLDDAEIAAQVRQAEAGLAAARASEAQARFDVERAAVALEQAGVSFKLAKDNFDRGKFLLEQGALFQADFEARFQTPYVNAEAGLKQAQISYEIAQDRLEHVVPAQVEQAQAALEAARLQLANTRIAAPAGGIVAARCAEVGEMAAPSQPLLTLVDIDRVEVEVSVTGAEINKIRTGQEVPVTVAAAGEQPFAGKITSLAPAADARSKMFPVKIALPNREHKLKPGMFAEVELTTEVHRRVLRVPAEAVLEKEGKEFVYVVEDGRARERRVETGLSDGEFTEVKAGLQEGEQVVVSGQDFLADGVKVTIAAESAGAAAAGGVLA